MYHDICNRKQHFYYHTQQFICIFIYALENIVHIITNHGLYASLLHIMIYVLENTFLLSHTTFLYMHHSYVSWYLYQKNNNPTITHNILYMHLSCVSWNYITLYFVSIMIHVHYTRKNNNHTIINNILYMHLSCVSWYMYIKFIT